MILVTKRWLPALLMPVLWLAAVPASAQVQRYWYSGHPFTTATPGYGLTQVSLWFDVDRARLSSGGHVVLDSRGTGGLLAWAFSDGHNTISNDPFDGYSSYSSARISFDTDAAGQIGGNWEAWASRAHGNLEGLILSDSIRTTGLLSGGPAGQPLMVDSASSLNAYTASVTGNPGVWSTMPDVPEPRSLPLMVLGLVLLPLGRRLVGRGGPGAA